MWRWKYMKIRIWKYVNMKICEDEKMWKWEDVKMWRWEDAKMTRCEDVKMFEDVYNRPPLLEEPFAQTLSGKIGRYKVHQGNSAYFAVWFCSATATCGRWDTHATQAGWALTKGVELTQSQWSTLLRWSAHAKCTDLQGVIMMDGPLHRVQGRRS